MPQIEGAAERSRQEEKAAAARDELFKVKQLAFGGEAHDSI